MNNRIMAMLFALVAAMFISIVPVKAEAEHVHVDSNKNCVCDVAGCTQTMHVAGTEWEYDKDGHNQKCTNCGVSMNRAAHTAGEVKVYPSDKTKHFQQCTVCLKSMNIAEHVEGDLKNCKCASCKYEWAHEYEAGKYEQWPGEHAQKCKNCGTLTEKVAHNLVWTKTAEGHGAVCSDCGYKNYGDKLIAHTYGAAVDNKDGTHSYTCEAENCKWVKTEDHVDGETDGNCICNECNAELEHKLGPWQQNLTHHQRVCTKSNCGEVVGAGEHNFGEAKAVEGHTYHVKVCEDCGFERQFDCTSTKDKDCLCDECGTMLKHTTAKMQYREEAATCTKDGWKKHYECLTCHNRFDLYAKLTTEEAVKAPALGHKLGGEAWVWHENADGTGHYKFCANNCGTHIYGTAEAVVVGEEAHSHGSWYDNKAGQHCEICAVCGESYGDEACEYKTPVKTDVLSGVAKKQQHGLQCECGAVRYEVCTFNDDCVCQVCGTEKIHSDKSTMTYVKAKAPTCTEAGHTDYYECNACGGTYLSDASAWDPALDALGHDWSARPNTLNGQHLQKCTRCSAYQTLDCQDTTGDCLCDVNNCGTLVHSHKLVFHNPVAATCEGKGTEGYFTYQECDKKMFDMDMNEIAAPVEIPATDHTPSGEWTPNEDVHEELCEDCGKVLETAEHVDENGDNRCDACDVALALELMPEQPATCTSIGYKACWVSPVSNRMYSDAEGRNHITAREVIPALGHKETGWIDQGGETHKMSCQRPGCTWSRTENHSGNSDCYCSVCGGVYEGHELTLVQKVPTTCKEPGTEAYYKCKCGEHLYDLSYNEIAAPKKITQLKHVMGTKVQKDVKEGKHYVKCTGCDYRMYENHGMELSDPNKGNYHQWLCECGELKIETHYDKNGDKKCDVCGHNMGTTSTKVEQHDNKTVYTGQSDSVNVHKDWFWNWQEWFTPSNSGGTTATGKVEENISSSNPGAGNGSANNGTANSGSSVEEEVVAPPTASEDVVERPAPTAPSTSTAPSAAQTSVLIQFVSWFLGLFGF